jgi:ectoine hydroxylase-related dioxygenase (phytanoyl-CoA dioxygenase family)
VAAAKAREYGRYLGHLVSHNPHRDSWFSQPVNGINAWIAVGPVHSGNGLLIYPAVFGRELAREKSEVARSEPLGVPLTVEMHPGDMLLFLGDHLHSSELNVTRFTRYVVSFRLTVGEPVYAAGERMTPYHRVAAPPVS